MDVREKLVEIVKKAAYSSLPSNTEDFHLNMFVTNLLAHGVTVQECISVKDRFPETIPCDAGTAYSEAVNVLTTGSKVLTAIWDGTDFIADAEFWDAADEEITHWTPVLLPLPQKGE